MRTLKIQGTTVVFESNWNVSSKINARSTASFNVLDLNGLSGIDVGDDVELTNDAAVIFSGIVSNVQKSESTPGVLEWSITCSDNCAKADKRIVADAAQSKTMKQTIIDHLLPILQEEGISADTSLIIDGPFINRVVFPYWTVSKALDHLCDLAGLNWNIDNNKKLRVFDRAEYVAPWTLTDLVQHKNFKQSQSMTKYRNRQYVLAGTGKTSLQSTEVPTPKPDGVSRKFILRFPVAETPVIYINGIAVPTENIGVNGLDKDKAWYFSYGSNVISQEPEEDVLNDSDGISVDYYGMYPIRTVLDNDAGITERQSAEPGTSGIYESVVSEKSLNTVSQATDYANALILKYGNVPDKVSFSTSVNGLEAGQLITITKPLYGISESFLIESIAIRPSDGDAVLYNISALDGAAVGGWEVFFKDLIGQATAVVVDDNEVLVVVKRISATITAQAALYCEETTLCSETTYCAGGKEDAIQWLLDSVDYAAVGTGTTPLQGDIGIVDEVKRNTTTLINAVGDKVVVDVLFDQDDANAGTLTNAAVLVGGTSSSGTGIVVAGAAMNIIKNTSKVLTISAEITVQEAA